MHRLPVLDTWQDYAESMPAQRGGSPEAVLDAWLNRYMAKWPELLRLQQDSYRQEGLDWRTVALEHVVPHLAERHGAMAVGRDALLDAVPAAAAAAERVIGEPLPLTCVIYVGIGCGAGWATEYEGRPAILFGLENMAECGWTGRDGALGLAAHEIGHLQHALLRRRAGVDDGAGPLWQLYSEGFAQRFEHAVAGRETWHMATADAGWLDWCRESRARLAAEFVRRVDAGDDIRAFFGSWFDIEGHSQSGYFLGHELLGDAERDHTLAELAVLPPAEVERLARAWLVAGGSEA